LHEGRLTGAWLARLRETSFESIAQGCTIAKSSQGEELLALEAAIVDGILEAVRGDPGRAPTKPG
jgi:hypothetical protein